VLAPAERGEQTRDHDRRRVDREHVAERRQQERGDGVSLPAAHLREIAPQDQPERGIEPLTCGTLRDRAHNSGAGATPTGRREHPRKKKGPSPVSGDGPSLNPGKSDG
jgi:hypothetical protein